MRLDSYRHPNNVQDTMGKVELKGKGLSIVVYRDGQHIGRVWWNAASEEYIAETASGVVIGEDPLRVTAIDMVTGWVSGEIAQQVRDGIAEMFGADPDYAPQVMDADWDGGAGRVIVWEHFPDWAYLVPHGGESHYVGGKEFGPMTLPAGVWVEPVNAWSVRVLPL
ncbi:hypothetical protein ACQP1V_42945 (plasmid) [Microtetraspora malaysiensis]|uniref:hypothetical protein n=1 Tax=Microtetraspora malaysiensis TaxID=161358 RepID=UPI003D8BC232